MHAFRNMSNGFLGSAITLYVHRFVPGCWPFTKIAMMCIDVCSRKAMQTGAPTVNAVASHCILVQGDAFRGGRVPDRLPDPSAVVPPVECDRDPHCCPMTLCGTGNKPSLLSNLLEAIVCVVL